MNESVQDVVARHGADKTRLIDMIWDIQWRKGYISDTDLAELGAGLDMSPLDVKETVSFYHFFRSEPFGKHAIYLCDSPIGRMNGLAQVRDALQRETGAAPGAVSEDGRFGFGLTHCIGLSDQEPAMMVDDVVFTRLTPAKVGEIIGALKAGKTAAEIANPDGHDSGTRAYVDAIVETNIVRAGPVFLQDGLDHRAILQACLERTPDEVIAAVTESGLRGRGGAGFPSGLKWRLARDADGAEKYVICNADEGEPGTFKDRALLTQSPRDVLLGMVIGGHAIGARHGIIYLRAEYWYLKAYLERQIADFRSEGLLGANILGSGTDFEIRIQMGAGAYICGDETALIESCEGKRGTPRVKPPYPIQQGYLGMPTAVNNVETYACVTRIIEKGAAWFAEMGTGESTGTRLVSVSGDCARPGIYEIEWGVSLNEVLALAGAQNALAVQISGPSGECASVEADGARRLCYTDLTCNGSFMVFDRSRDLLDIVRQFTKFFVDESCGICTPCRAGGVDMLGKIDRVIAGKAMQKDLDDCVQWGGLMRATSRCGLGTTAAKPILTTLIKFPELYSDRLTTLEHFLLPGFDAEGEVGHYDEIVKSLYEEANA